MLRTARWANLALVTSFCAASPALAADWSTDTARILGDPSFLPLAGQAEGVFSYTYSANLYDLTSQDPFDGHSSYDRSENGFLPTLRFGVTDDISVFADLGFGNARATQDRTYENYVFTPYFTLVHAHARVTYHSLGAVDPDFGVTWRVIDQRTAPVSVDVTGSYAPDIFQNRSAERLQTGTFATGGQSGSAQLAISRETQVVTLRAYGTFTYNGRRNDTTGDGTEDLRSAAHPSYAVGLQSEARVTPWLAINAGVGASQAVQYDRPLLAGDQVTPETVKPSGSISPYAGVVVPLLGPNIVGEALYQHDFINNESVQVPFGQSYRYYKQESNEFTARLLVTFGGAPAVLPPPAFLERGAGMPPAPQPARTYLVFFDWDRADLTARARQIVAEAAAASAHVQTTRIEVNGYTDLSGTATYNQRLSVRRAQSVAGELVRDGVPRGEIGIHGYGESNPLVQTKAGVREPQNRRVEIILR